MPTRGSYAGDPTAGDVLTAANFKKLPGGWIDYESSTSAIGPTSGTTELDVLSAASVPMDANRRIKVSVHIPKVTTTVTSDDFAVKIYVAGAVIARLTIKLSSPATETGADLFGVVDNVSAGNVAVKFTVVRAAGTGTITFGASTNQPIAMLVEDIGSSS